MTRVYDSDPIDVLIADDHPIFRAGMRQLLAAESDLKVVAEAESAEETFALVRELEPRVVVLDAAMARADGNDTTRRIAAEVPASRVLILVVNAVEECHQFALDSGASGCLSKLRADRELVEAIRSIAGGGLYFSALDTVPSGLAHGGGNGSGNGSGRGEPKPDEVLSDRERQVVILTASGYSSREIGSQLHISSKTVDTYRARSMDKLGFHHRWELVQYALRNGLLAAL